MREYGQRHLNSNAENGGSGSIYRKWSARAFVVGGLWKRRQSWGRVVKVGEVGWSQLSERRVDWGEDDRVRMYVPVISRDLISLCRGQRKKGEQLCQETGINHSCRTNWNLLAVKCCSYIIFPGWGCVGGVWGRLLLSLCYLLCAA